MDEFMGSVSRANETGAFFLSERMLSSRPNFLQLGLKIEETNESRSDVTGLFNSERGRSA